MNDTNINAPAEIPQPEENNTTSGTTGAYPYAGAQSAPAAKKQRTAFALDVKDILFTCAAAVCSVAIIFMGLWGDFNLGFTVSYTALFAVLSVYLCRRGAFPGIYACVCGLLTLGITPVFFTGTNPAVRFLSFIALCCLSSVWFYSLAGRTTEKGDLGLVRNMLVYTAGNTGSSLDGTFRGLFFGKGEKKKELGKVFVGILCAAPLALIVTILLTSADDAFEGLVGSVFGNIGADFFKTILGLFCGFFVTAFAFGMKKTAPDEVKEPRSGRLGTTYAAAFTGLLGVCYLVYLFSQLAYFFNAFQGILPEGYSFSYAEYARRGFFELCGIAAINFAVVFAVLLITEKKDGKLRPVLQAICTFICVFTLVIISTAIAKMYMYIREYGMTLLRIETSAFMLFLAVVFLSLILRLFLPRVRVMRAALVTAACVLIILGTADINAFIAKYNYENIYVKAPTCEAVYELDELGDEGIPYIVKLADSPEEGTAEAAQDVLFLMLRYEAYYKCEYVSCEQYYNGRELMYDKWDFDKDIKVNTGFTKINLAVQKAYEALDGYLETHPEMINAVETWSYFYPAG